MVSTELRQRITSGIILGAIVIALTLWSFTSFAAMCAVGFVILIKEWVALTKQRSRIFVPLGILYISAAIAGLIYLRAENLNILIALMVIVWTGDIAAYFVGRAFGKL